MPKGYLVAHIRVHDPEKFEEFRALAGPAAAQYGARVLVASPMADFREGEVRGITVVIEFDDFATAKQFYEGEGYTAARAVRQLCAETDLLLVEGV